MAQVLTCGATLRMALVAVDTNTSVSLVWWKYQQPPTKPGAVG